MEINVNESNYIDIPKISSIKNYIFKLGEYIIDNDNVSCDIKIDISYFDSDGNDIFITRNIPITILLNNKKLNSIELNNISLEVIDSRGVNAYYDILIDVSENIIEEIEIKEETRRIGNLDEEIKELENIEEIIDLDDKKEEILEANILCEESNLNDTLLKPDTNVEIISTKSSLNEDSFISFFNNMTDTFSYIRTINIKNELELNDISKKYKKSIDELYKGYDKENKVLIINTNE